MDASEENWYIVKQDTGQCNILAEQDLSGLETTRHEQDNVSSLEKWGPFKSKHQAIAKRVGLIRAGKCQPQ